MGIPPTFDEENTETPLQRADGLGARPQRTVRSATFNSADGGTRPLQSREAAYKSRERQLIEGLPQRTSQWARDTERWNAKVGNEDRKKVKVGRSGWRWEATGADAEVDKRLDAKFASEDANYTNAYTQLTGRQDQGIQNDRALQNQRTIQGLSNQGALERQGLVNRGEVDTQRLRNSGALDVQDMRGRDAYAIEGLRQRGETERNTYSEDEASRRAGITADPQLIEAKARYGTPALAQQRLDLEKNADDRTQTQFDRAMDLEKQATAKQGLANRLAPLAGNDPAFLQQTVEALPTSILQMQDQEAQLQAAEQFLIQQYAEQKGVVRERSGPFGKQRGIGSLRGYGAPREVTAFEEFTDRVRGEIPFLDRKGYKQGNLVYESEGKDPRFVDPQDLPRRFRDLLAE